GQVIYPNQIRSPLPSFGMRKQRRVRSHYHHLCVSFQSGHKCCFGHSTLPVVLVVRACDGHTLSSVFRRTSLRTLPVVAVVAGCMFPHPYRLLAVMLINHLPIQFSQSLIQVIKFLAFGGWTSS